MYYKIVRTKTFIKDMNKLKISNQQYTKLIIYLSKLATKEPLPKEAKDHQLKGLLKEFREFHIGGDLLVMYKIENNQVILVRIGSHSELFK